jgi:hypothetical protein
MTKRSYNWMVPSHVDWQAQIHNQENRYTHLLEPQMNSENNYRLKSYVVDR